MTRIGKSIRAHPMRLELMQEIHARPYESIEAPEYGSHLAMVIGENQTEDVLTHLSKLFEHFDSQPPDAGTKFYSGSLGPFRLRWEQHTEFCTYTFFCRENSKHPFSDPIIKIIPDKWFKELPGEAIAAVHFAIESDETPEKNFQELSALFDGNPIIGALVSGDAARVWSDLRIHEDGFSRILVRDHSLSPLQGGRLLQRLLEINCYRLLALLALPLAREDTPHIHRMELALKKVTEKLSQNASSSEAKGLLDELSGLASELEEIGARTSYRFSATQAYFDIVQSRLQEIRQKRIQGLQTFSEFLERRLVPGVNYCFSTRDRLDNLSERMSRVGSLIRARVEVQIEEQNRDLLASMNHRAKMQFRLQRIVEGLSVVAITYYLLGLIKYGLEGIAATGSPINTHISAGIILPIILILVWLALYRARRSVETEPEEE